MISPKTGLRARLWRIRNGGGGWVHPMHLHMEEHRVVSRNGKPAPDPRHPDDTGKEDVVGARPERGRRDLAGSGRSPARTSRTATTSPTRTTR